MIRVLLVDDHKLGRAGLQSLVGSAADLTVVGSTSDGEEAVRMVAELGPDVVLMNLSMPGMDGIEATRRISARNHEVLVLVLPLTSCSDGDRVRGALDAGAVGYLLKDAEPQDLLDGVRAVSRGESTRDARAARAMLPMPPKACGDDLTDRERQVLELITRGMANKQIASALHISERTVKTHVGSIFRRIGVADRTSAAIWAESNLRAQQ